MKGARPAILAVVTMLLVSYATWRRRELPISWPLAAWTMYSNKARKPLTVRWRRFRVIHADGRTRTSDLSRPLRFLGKAYRIDAMLDRNVPRFLLACLRVIQADDASVVGLVWEKRAWSPLGPSYGEHLREAAAYTYQVLDLPPRPSAERPAANLLGNSDFQSWARAGDADGWDRGSSWIGVGVGPDDDRALLLVPNPNRKRQSVEQRVPVPPDLAGREVRLDGWVLTRGAPAFLALEGVESPRAPTDGAWHRLEVSRRLAGETELRVVLEGGTGTIVAFDGVALSAEGN